jgi:DNA polymerase II small subunit
MDKKQQVIDKLFRKGILLNEELLEETLHVDVLSKLGSEEDLLVLNADYAEIIAHEAHLIDWYDIDKYRVGAEKERDDNLYQAQLQQLQTNRLVLQQENQETTQTFTSLETELGESGSEFVVTQEHRVLDDSLPVHIILSFDNQPRKYTVNDFASIFLSRYRFLESVLRNRQELASAMTIHRIQDKKEREQVAIIGLVHEVRETRKGSILLTVEDPTGKMNVLLSQQKKELFAQAKDIVADEVIGISGMNGDNIIFAEKIVWPDLPRNRELKRGENNESAIFLSDVHVGSTYFLEESFSKFLKWINGQAGSEKQKVLAESVKYIFIAGDLVDGIGVYPSQEDELSITTLHGQYAEFCRLIRQIPSNKRIILSPGNHDGVHLAEPQPIFCESYAPELHTMPNVTLVTNPSLVNIGRTDTFSGFDVLLYHGYSFDYYVRNVESIRMSGGYHRADLIMQFLLKRRHLAPSFTSTPYFPGHAEDPLLIKMIPDFFLSGHIHYSSVANYRGVTMICGSCWQGKTSFQEKLGHEPEPGRVPLVNLQTREVKVLKFV